MNKVHHALEILDIPVAEACTLKANVAVAMKTCLYSVFALRRHSCVSGEILVANVKSLAANAFDSWSTGLRMQYSHSIKSGSGLGHSLAAIIEKIDAGYRPFLSEHYDEQVSKIACLLPAANMSTREVIVAALAEEILWSDEFDHFLVGNLDAWRELRHKVGEKVLK